METPVSPQSAAHQDCEETESDSEQSFSTTSDVGGLFVVLYADSLVASDPGATPHLARSPQLERHNRISG